MQMKILHTLSHSIPTKICFFSLIILLLTDCDLSSPGVRHDIHAFGVNGHITIIGHSREKAKEIGNFIEKTILHHEPFGNPNNPDGELYQLNKAIAQAQSFKVSKGLQSLIDISTRLSRSSSELFNPAAGELTLLWEYYCTNIDCLDSLYSDEIKRLINEKESEVISHHPSMNDLEIKDNTLTSKNPTVKLEFGDIIKGYALERGIESLHKLNVKNAMIFLGNSVRIIGKNGTKPWWIGLPLSSSAENMIGTIEFKSVEAAVTIHGISSSQVKNGFIYRHVVDPRTGLPVDVTDPISGISGKSIESVTVIHDSATTASAAATALLINGREGWKSIASNMGVELIIMIAQDGSIYASQKLRDRIHWKFNHKPKLLTAS